MADADTDAATDLAQLIATAPEGDGAAPDAERAKQLRAALKRAHDRALARSRAAAASAALPPPATPLQSVRENSAVHGVHAVGVLHPCVLLPTHDFFHIANLCESRKRVSPPAPPRHLTFRAVPVPGGPGSGRSRFRTVLAQTPVRTVR